MYMFVCRACMIYVSSSREYFTYDVARIHYHADLASSVVLRVMMQGRTIIHYHTYMDSSVVRCQEILGSMCTSWIKFARWDGKRQYMSISRTGVTE